MSAPLSEVGRVLVLAPDVRDGFDAELFNNTIVDEALLILKNVYRVIACFDSSLEFCAEIKESLRLAEQLRDGLIASDEVARTGASIANALCRVIAVADSSLETDCGFNAAYNAAERICGS
jgi:hypothetical protein